MIEKRTMAVVESSHRVKPIMAMYDNEKQEVVCYQYVKENDDEDDCEEWYQNYPFERYFKTLQEANEYVAKRQEYLRSKFSEVLEFIKEMDSAEGKFFKFDKKEYLGGYAENNNRDWLKDERDEYKAEASLLCSIARTRHFNINGETINIDEVEYVLWHDDNKATLCMDNGHKVKTYSDVEFKVVEDMFGSNRSGRVTNI